MPRKPRFSVRRKMKPRFRYIILKGDTPLIFRFQSGFKRREDANMVCYWLNRQQRTTSAKRTGKGATV